MRLLIDRCISRRVIEALRTDGHDVMALLEAGLDPSDRDILTLAFSEARSVVTEDADFGDHLFRDRMRSAGVLRVPQVPPHDQVPLVRRALTFRTGDLEAGALVTVRRNRIRVAWPDRL